MKKGILYLFLFFSYTLFSQSYTAIDTSDYIQRKSLIQQIDADFKKFKKSLKKKHKGRLRKEVQKSYEYLHKDFSKNIEKKNLVFNSEFTNYINHLTTKITESNPDLANNDIKVYVSRHNSPNALSMGNGVILLNMGLFKYLQNEAQLVSVLTHEIAHQKLKHAENNILYKSKLNISKEKKRQAKEIRRQKYNQYDKAFGILKNLLYTNSENHRKQESEADSLGYKLFKNLKYNNTSFIKALSILEKLEKMPPINITRKTYYKIFNLPKQRFKKEWIHMEDFNTYNYNNYSDKINKDSLKSHPEITERIRKLKKIFPELRYAKNSYKKNKTFSLLKNISFKEDIANLNYLEKYGLSIYLTLYKLQQKPKNDINYHKAWLGKNFQALYEAKKKYLFNRYVDRLNPKEQDKSYQQFLNFMWNLNLQEIKNIADHYTK